VLPKRRLSGKAPGGGKASPRLEIRHKVTVAATKTRIEKGSNNGEEDIRRRQLRVRLRRAKIRRQLVDEDGGDLGEDGSDGRNS
jgi:hypothetical protein